VPGAFLLGSPFPEKKEEGDVGTGLKNPRWQKGFGKAEFNHGYPDTDTP